MENSIFKLSNYKTNLFILVVSIIILVLWIFMGFYISIVTIILFIILIFSQINKLTMRLLIDQDGLVIWRIFRQPISIDWNDIIGQQYFNSDKRVIDYLVLRKPIPIIDKIQYADVPKEHQSTIFIINLWEQPTHLMAIIQQCLPSISSENQIFVPFSSKRYKNTTKIAIIVMIVAVIVTIFTIMML